jgi:hypothetical protein
MQPEAVRETALWSPANGVPPRSRSGAPTGDVLLEIYGKAGYTAFWREWIHLAQQFGKEEGKGLAPPILLPVAYLQIRDKDRALDSLEESLQRGNPNLIYLRADPLFDPLRSEPRFQELERRVGLR